MDTLNSAYVGEQGKISAAGAWIWLIAISKSGYSTMRYANNNEDVSWPETTDIYSAISFAMDDVTASLQGKFPEYRLSIGEVELDSVLRIAVKASGGLVGGTVRLIVVHSDHLTLTTPAIDEYATILSCEVTADAVVFTLGIPNLLSRRFPRDRYVPGICRHKFAGALCGYAASKYTDCDHTLGACKLRNNTQNYGGSPGVAGGVYG